MPDVRDGGRCVIVTLESLRPTEDRTVIRMTPENWDRLRSASKWIDPDTGQRYVCLYVGKLETWEEVEIVSLDRRNGRPQRELQPRSA